MLVLDPLGLGERVLGRDRGHPVDEIHIDEIGDEAIADALNAVIAGVAAAHDRRFGRLHGHDPDVGKALSQRGADSHQGAPGTDARDERIDRLRAGLAQLLAHFRSGGRLVAERVVRVGELIGHVKAREVLVLVALGDRQLESPLARGEPQLGAESSHELLALLAHVLRHVDDHRVTELPRHHRHGDAGVPGRRLDDRVAGQKIAALAGAREDELRDPVLDAAARVGALEFDPDPVDLAQRSIADEVQGFAHGSLPSPAERRVCARVLIRP